MSLALLMFTKTPEYFNKLIQQINFRLYLREAMKLFSLLVLVLLIVNNSESDDVVEDVYKWCYDKYDKFWHATYEQKSKNYHPLSCCSHMAFVDKPENLKQRCAIECVIVNETDSCCQPYCLLKEQKIFVDGSLNTEGLKEECMNSVRSIPNLADRYDAVIDESIRKCVDACK